MKKCRALLLIWFILALGIFPLSAGAEDKDQKDSSDFIELDDVIISATRTPASLDSISASSSIVSEKQIKSSPASDIGHLLEMTNILEVIDYGPGGVSIASMRGSSQEQVLVLIDGERINNSRYGGVDLDNISTTYAKRIEVVRGGHSAMYGADAVGGIINIITKQPVGSKAQVWGSAGAYGAATWGVEASKQYKAVSGLVSFSHVESESDFPFEDKNSRELIRENASTNKRSVLGKFNWAISEFTNLHLSGDHLYADRGDPGPIGLYTPEANKQDRNFSLKATLEHELGNNALIKLSGSKGDATLRYVNPLGLYPVDDTHKNNIYGTELQVYLLRNTNMPLTGGIALRNDNVASTALGDRTRDTYSGYIQQEFSRNFIGSALKLNRVVLFPAVRWDHYSDFEAGISPKIGFLASFGKSSTATVRANIGKSYRAPTMNELYWPADAFASGNPDLKPERSVNMDAGLYLSLARPVSLPQLSLVTCGVSYFQNSFDDRIQWTPREAGKWSPLNLSEALSTGLEAEMRTGIFSNLVSLGANYMFLKAEDMLERQLVYRPRHSLGYSVRVGTQSLWGQLQGLYRSRRYYTVQNTKWLEPFMKYDLQFGMERRVWSSTNMGLILEIRNVLDKKYQQAADYPLPGREWSIKTSISMEGK